MTVTGNSSLTYDTDKHQMSSFNHVEIPVRGPDPVTTLVIISGIVITALDIDTPYEDQVEAFELFIETEYRLPNKENWVDSAAFAWLAAIDDDDRHGENGYWIDTVDAQPDVNGRVLLHILGHLRSDARIDRIGYQVYVQSSQPRPSHPLAQHPLAGWLSKRPYLCHF